MTPQKSSLTVSRVVNANSNATGGAVTRNQATGIACAANEYAKVTIVIANLSGTNPHTINFGVTAVATVPGPAVRIDSTLFQLTVPVLTTSATYEITLGPGQTLYAGSTSDGVTANNPYWYLNAVVYINS